MTTKVRVLLILGVVVAGVVVFVLYFFFMMAGGRGWNPDRQSARAVRAYAIDRRLRLGLRKADVLKIFKADVRANPDDDMVVETDVTFNRWDRPCPAGTCTTGNGAGQFELETFDMPHGLDGFGTAWSVRTRFDRQGRLVMHEVHVEACCGP